MSTPVLFLTVAAAVWFANLVLVLLFVRQFHTKKTPKVKRHERPWDEGWWD